MKFIKAPYVSGVTIYLPFRYLAVNVSFGIVLFLMLVSQTAMKIMAVESGSELLRRFHSASGQNACRHPAMPQWFGLVVLHIWKRASMWNTRWFRTIGRYFKGTKRKTSFSVSSSHIQISPRFVLILSFKWPLSKRFPCHISVRIYCLSVWLHIQSILTLILPPEL
jgi:hypothetical protein